MRHFAIVLLACIALCTAAAADPLHFDASSRWIQIPVSNPAGQSAQVLFGDVNADGAADLVLYNMQRGEAYVALSNRHGFATPILFATGLPTYTGTGEMPLASLADVNADGRADLIILNHGADDVAGAATARVALSTGSHFVYPANPVWNASWCATYQTCLFADLNGDHRADMVAFTPTAGTVWASLSTGVAFSANAIWNKFFCIKGEVCALGDVDGDGRADAILFKPHATGAQKGNVLVARSTGSGFAPVRTGHGFFCIDLEQCLVGDVNGDRRADIVLIKNYGAPTLDVLVSLSNGTSFINSNPFRWAQPSYFNASAHTFGSFALADVAGSGRAALLQYGLTMRGTTGGGEQTTGWAVDVYIVTDRSVTPPPPPAKPAQPGGFSAANVYNCHPNQDQLTFWTFDTVTGASSQTGPVDAMYSDSGRCPDPQDAPRHLPLAPGHVSTIVAVDPQAIGCEGRNDPSILACVNNSASFNGTASGGVCNWIVSAQAPACAK